MFVILVMSHFAVEYRALVLISPVYLFTFQIIVIIPEVFCTFRSLARHQRSLYIFSSHGGLLVLCWCYNIAAHDSCSETTIKEWKIDRGQECQILLRSAKEL